MLWQDGKAEKARRKLIQSPMLFNFTSEGSYEAVCQEIENEEPEEFEDGVSSEGVILH